MCISTCVYSLHNKNIGKLDSFNHYHLGTWACFGNLQDGFYSVIKRKKTEKPLMGTKKKKDMANGISSLPYILVTVNFILIVLGIELSIQNNIDREAS